MMIFFFCPSAHPSAACMPENEKCMIMLKMGKISHKEKNRRMLRCRDMYVSHVVMCMTRKKEIRTAESSRERRLRIFRRTGSVQCADSGKMYSCRRNNGKDHKRCKKTVQMLGTVFFIEGGESCLSLYSPWHLKTHLSNPLSIMVTFYSVYDKMSHSDNTVRNAGGNKG